MTFISDLDISILAFVAAFLLGISKAGVKGLGIFVVTLLAIAYGGKSSTGLLMPLLIVGDIFAVYYYRKHVVWPLLGKLLPAMLVGVLIGVSVGQHMDELVFKKAMSAIILISVIIMYSWDRWSKDYIPTSPLFAYTMGLLAGFTTMIGNLAGAFSNIFFLAMQLDKNKFIGTAAYLFFIVNLFKLPFHIFYWRTITSQSILIDMWLVPALLVGLVVGITVLKKVNTEAFRKLILILTAVGAVIILCS